MFKALGFVLLWLFFVCVLNGCSATAPSSPQHPSAPATGGSSGSSSSRRPGQRRPTQSKKIQLQIDKDRSRKEHSEEHATTDTDSFDTDDEDSSANGQPHIDVDPNKSSTRKRNDRGPVPDPNMQNPANVSENGNDGNDGSAGSSRPADTHTSQVPDHSADPQDFEGVEGNGHSTIGGDIPVWQPNDSHKECQVCAKGFSRWSRKHHCRECGRVVCASCSDHKAKTTYRKNSFKNSLEYNVDKTKLRVCTKCNDMLHADVNKINTNGETQLTEAISNRDSKRVKILLQDENIDVNKCKGTGQSPLTLAVMETSLAKNHLDVFQSLLKGEGQQAPSAGATLEQDLTMSRGILKDLLNAKNVDVNKKDRTKDGHTPLTIAVSQRDCDVVDMLLATPGIDVNKPNTSGISPFHIAFNPEEPRPQVEISKSSVDKIFLLLIADGIEKCEKQDEYVKVSGLVPDVDGLAINNNSRRNRNSHILVLNVALRNDRIINALLSRKNIDVNVSHPTKKRTPLTQLIRTKGHNELSSELNDILTTMLRTLLACPTLDINKKDDHEENCTPLLAAVYENDESVVDILLEKPNIDIHLSARNDNPMLSAIWNRRLEIVKKLLSRPDLDIDRMLNGQRAVTMAASKCLSRKTEVRFDFPTEYRRFEVRAENSTGYDFMDIAHGTRGVISETGLSVTTISGAIVETDKLKYQVRFTDGNNYFIAIKVRAEDVQVTDPSRKASKEILEAILSKSPNLELENLHGETVLDVATKQSNEDAIRVLQEFLPRTN